MNRGMNPGPLDNSCSQERENEARQRSEIQKALQNSENWLIQIIEGSSIPTFVIDRNHRITHWNRACENLTGLKAADMIGGSDQWRPFYAEKRPVMADLLVENAGREEISAYYKGRFRESKISEEAYEAEGFFPGLGETGKWLFFTASPIREPSGRIIGAMETLQDITERKLAEAALKKSEKRFRTLFDFAPYPMVVFSLDGRVAYLNPAFTATFGWTLQELAGEKIPYLPSGLEAETKENIQKLFREKVLIRYETKRLTKDGRLLDVVMRATLFSEAGSETESETGAGAEPAGELVILRDVTQEKRNAEINEALFRISAALPQYPEMEGLFDYISNEVKRLLGSEGALVVLLDEERQELFFTGVAYDDSATEKRIKEISFGLDEVAAGRVIRMGEPLIMNDENHGRENFPDRDRKLGYRTRNLAEAPLRSSGRIIGVLAALNKKEGGFNQDDLDLLSMIAGTVALSVENARYAEELKKAYMEASSLNRAKDKAIHHLSHELKTPVSVIAGSLNVLEKKLGAIPEASWRPTLDRIGRNLRRLGEIQDEVDDIMKGKTRRTYNLLSLILNQCRDELETVLAEYTNNARAVELVRKRIDDIFGPDDPTPENIDLKAFVADRLSRLKPLFSHRELKIEVSLADAPPIVMPRLPLEKIFDGVLKNAAENTPDEGLIRITLRRQGGTVRLEIHDYGVGVTEGHRRRIFEGFYATQDTLDYSSKRPFDFNAGGKGADLLRAKIFSEQYGFKIDMASSRCRYIPLDADVCPGRISLCAFCSSVSDCRESGWTRFSLYFPASAPGEGDGRTGGE